MRSDRPVSRDPEEQFLLDLRDQNDRPIRVGGDKPISLGDPGLAWVVCSGRVDIFWTQAAEGQAAGPRRHLCRIEAGQAFFGMDLRRAVEGVQVLAVGVAGTTLLELGRTRLVELTKDLAHGDRAAALLEGWVTSLSAAVGKDVFPEEPRALAFGREIALNDHETVRAERGTVWVRHLEGSSRFLGDPDLAPITGDGFFPVSDPAWLESSGRAVLLGVDTRSYAARDGKWSGLDAFHATVVSSLVRGARRSAAEQQEQMRQRTEVDRMLVQSAMRRLGTVIETDSRAVTPEGMVADGPLLDACRVVGRAIGVEIRRPERPDGARDPLDEISRASRVRMRRVALTGDWWRQDSGPLLGFLGEDEHPVALLPKGVAAYVMVDPAGGARQPVTRETAARLMPFAYIFYAPFPDRPLGASDLLRYSLRGLRGDLIRVLLMGVAGGLLGMLVPIATKQITDFAIPRAEAGLAVAIALGLVVAAICAMLFEVVRSFAVLRIETKLDTSVQSAVWDRLLSLPAPFFRDYPAGDLAMRALGINAIRQTVTGATISSLLSGLFSVFSLGVIFYYSVRLGLIATLMAAVIVGVTAATGLLQLRYQRRTAEIEGKVSSLVLQLLTGIAKLRVAGAEMRAFAIWAARYSAQKANDVRAQSATNALTVFNSASGILTSLVIFAALAFFFSGEGLSAGEFVAFNTAFAQFLFASTGITAAFTTLLEATPYYERAKPILQTLPEVDTEKPDPGGLNGRVELNHVFFRYDPDGPLVLEDVSLRAEPGEFVAIVGPSGSGKSSLFRLLLGFEEPEAGSIYYDDHDLSGINVQAVRRQMGVVLQNGKLMSGTIFQNIAGVSTLTMDEAWEAVRMAGLDADIEMMPMGMFTFLGEGTSAISGGQRQRLMIARAIASRPRILLFDEATSALDNETQAIVSSSLEKLRATRMVIAHRLSTILNADRIYVLRAGRIVQNGTYDELMDQDGPFRELAARQLV